MTEYILNQSGYKRHRADSIGSIFGAVETLSDVKALSNIMPSEITECSICITSENPNVDHCSSAGAIEVMKKIINAPANTKPVDVVKQTKQSLKCDTERCIIESAKFAELVNRDRIAKELFVRFKIPGPTNTMLLSNVNIDKSLLQWAIYKPEFFPYNFNMVDYEAEGDTLATVDVADLYKKSHRCFACVINSDKYDGQGKHWMALFGDMRGNPWTVEFFNSSGNAPVQAWIKWLVKTRDRFIDIIAEYKLTLAPPEIVKVSDVRHQKTKSECGVYSLYYIWSRLQGTPYTKFRSIPVPDSIMFEFRQHLFVDPRREMPKKFNLEDYIKHTKIEWE